MFLLSVCGKVRRGRNLGIRKPLRKVFKPQQTESNEQTGIAERGEKYPVPTSSQPFRKLRPNPKGIPSQTRLVRKKKDVLKQNERRGGFRESIWERF